MWQLLGGKFYKEVRLEEGLLGNGKEDELVLR